MHNINDKVVFVECDKNGYDYEQIKKIFHISYNRNHYQRQMLLKRIKDLLIDKDYIIKKEKIYDCIFNYSAVLKLKKFMKTQYK